MDASAAKVDFLLLLKLVTLPQLLQQHPYILYYFKVHSPIQHCPRHLPLIQLAENDAFSLGSLN